MVATSVTQRAKQMQSVQVGNFFGAFLPTKLLRNKIGLNRNSGLVAPFAVFRGMKTNP